MEDTPYQRAFDHALKLLAIRKRSVRQLEHRLAGKAFDPAVIREVVSKLKQLRLLDDTDFAREYVSTKIGRGGAGRLKLRAALRKKGVPDTIVKEAVAEVDPADEFEAALTLAQHKALTLAGIDRLSRRKKIYDFLARKGYPFEVCREIIRKIH
jgi:regulatory protein